TFLLPRQQQARPSRRSACRQTLWPKWPAWSRPTAGFSPRATWTRSACRLPASKAAMLDRLVGLETEYVLRFRPHEPDRRRVPNRVLFERLLSRLRAEVPVASAIVGQNCWFLGNGGGLRYEFLPYYQLLPAAGFIE